MNKKKLLAMLKAKQELRDGLVTKAESTEDIKELRSLNTQMSELNKDITDLRAMIDDIEAEERASAGADPAAGDDSVEVRSTQGGDIIATYGAGAKQSEARSDNGELKKSLESRGALLKDRKPIVVGFNETAEERAITVASDTLVVQTKYSNTLSPKFNEVSLLVDRVSAVPLNGGEAYVKGYEISDGDGDVTAETGAYTSAEPTYGYVSVGKSKITAYAEITDEATKLPNILYQALVTTSLRKAIRKAIVTQIVSGDGTSNNFTGILNASTDLIPTATDVEISAIDEGTLDTIVFGYGGDESIEGDATLILNKQTLAAFNAIRATDGKKLYKISFDPSGNTGTISSDDSFSVPFIITSNLDSFADATVDTDYFAIYGKLSAYEMPVFSPLTIEESKDFKFSTGQVAYRASVWAGGNVVMYKGFVKVKKVSA